MLRVFFCVLLLSICTFSYAEKLYTAGWVVSQNSGGPNGVRAAVVGCLVRDESRNVLIPDCSMKNLMGPMMAFPGGFSIYLLTDKDGKRIEIPDRCLGMSAIVHGVINVPAVGAPRYGMNEIVLVSIGGGEDRQGRDHICYPAPD